MYRIPENRSGRSVNDYQTQRALRQALRTNDTRHTANPNSNAAPIGVSAPRATSAAIHSTSSLMRPNPRIDWIVDGYDKETSHPPILEMEVRRLAVLKSYRVVGSERNADCERLLSLVCRLFKAPIALISVIDLGRQYVLAGRGMGDFVEGPRKISICAHAIISKLDMLIIPDLTKDVRFKNFASVTDTPGLRFYASAPLVCPEGFRLGTVCILDTNPRPEGLSLEQKQNLREIADMVMDSMVEHREMKNHEYRNPSQVIACTSNDLLTPLKGVINGLTIIQEDESLFSALAQREVVSTAMACSNVMDRICKKSLRTFKMGFPLMIGEGQVLTDTEEDTPSLLNIKDLVKHLHVVMEPFPKQVPLIITADPGVPNVVVADDLKVFRSAVNYLTNACAQTEKGSVHLKIYTEEDDNENDTRDFITLNQNLVFSVEDSGPGISVQKYHFLFKPLPKDQGSVASTCSPGMPTRTSAKKPEVGLGLYAVSTHIASIGGKYGFRPREFTESGSQNYDDSGNPMKGSVFWFSIPLVLPDADFEEMIGGADWNDFSSRNEDTHATARSVQDLAELDEERDQDETVSLSTDGRRRRALIIDDSLSCRKTILRQLRKLGFEVTQAVNGMEGLRALRSTLFDLVLCDFLMPVMDGIECVQQYRSFEVANRPWFDQFIVGISAHANEKSIIEKGLEGGMNDYRSKPLTDEDLSEILEGQGIESVTRRLDAMANESREKSSPPAKRLKTEKSDSAFGNQRIVCLIAQEEKTVSAFSENEVDNLGLKVVVVHDGEAALRLLKMRNWDAVLLDDELPGLSSSKCALTFREWEKTNRVKRQNNIVQMSSSFIPTKLHDSSSVQLPTGLDAAIGKPISQKVLLQFLREVRNGESCQSGDILCR